MAAQVHPELVRDLVPLSRAGVIFELGNALAARDLRLSLKLVRRLLDQDESAIGILLVAIVPTIRLLTRKGFDGTLSPSTAHSPFQFISSITVSQSGIRSFPRKEDGAINAYPLGSHTAGGAIRNDPN